VKVLLTVHQFLPDSSAGTEILCLNTARHLRDAGHDVRIVTAQSLRQPDAPAEAFDEYDYDGLTVHRYRRQAGLTGTAPNAVDADYRNPRVERWFDGLLRRDRPDIVHAFHLLRLSGRLIDLCNARGVPVVLSATDFWMICPLGNLSLPGGACCAGPDAEAGNCLRHLLAINLPRRLRVASGRIPDGLIRCASGLVGRLGPRNGALSVVRSLRERRAFLADRLARADRVVVATRWAGRLLLEAGLDAEKLVHRPFGLAWREPDAPPRRYDAPALRVGFIGSLIPVKGAHVLLEAMRRLAGEAIEAVVYGDLATNPAYSRRLRDHAAGQQVTFAGTFPNERIGEVIRSLDVLVVPSLWYENMPLVVLSAKADRCPVIASDYPGLSEVVSDGADGALFAPGDADALATHLRHLAVDRDALRRLSENAPPPKSIARYAEEMVDLYRELIARPEA
jgi:glycosyltransferase involved in cell wall biosynthesis